MPAQWLSSTSDFSERASRALESALRDLSQPARARRLRQVVLALLALWLIYSLARLVWALYPGESSPLADQPLINPVSRGQAVSTAAPVDVARMRGWHLFGETGAQTTVVVEQPVATAQARDGIEKGARESSLQLRLRGVVASTTDGLGHAIIEYRKEQAVYAVEDKLPVSGEVTLAKVMPRQVVLDNGGTYELLSLYEETELDAQVSADRPTAPASENGLSGRPTAVDKRREESTTTLAQGYRDRLYQNPQSLAEVVNVSAVRVEGELQGYRIAPGKERAQFEQLGFKAGDLVTGINGITLDDPANTMQLYQTMRTATEAVFEIERGGQPVSLSVSLQGLDEGPGGQ